MADLVEISNAAADAAGIPRLLLLACAVAESNLGASPRRPVNPSDDERFWPDVSFGAWHQSVRWSQEHLKASSKAGRNSAAFPGVGAVEAIGAAYVDDPEYAAEVAAAQLKAKYRPTEDDAIFKALNRYNYPAGNGVPKGPAQAANYRRGIADAERILASAPPSPALSGVVYDDYRDPQPAGRFATVPKGIILHGSRSGRAGNPKDAEYRGTASWEVNNPDGLGWNATIGEGKVAVHLTPREWGWNARGSSDNWLAVELAQATVDEPITDGQVAALADWIRTRVLPVWPGLPMHFPTHAELDGTSEYGQRDGKTDVYPLGDRRMDELRARLLTALGPPPTGGDVTEAEAAALRARNAELEAMVADKDRRLTEVVSLLGYARGDVANALQAAVNSLKDLVPSP